MIAQNEKQTNELSNGHANRILDVAVQPTWRDRLPSQRKIAIVAWAPDTMKLAPWNDPSWQIWVVNDMAASESVPRWDVCFEIHRYPFESENPYRQWMRQHHGKPIFLAELRTEVPDGIALPVAEITSTMGRYFTNSVSWMLATAILVAPEEIGIWGVNMAQDGEYAHQRPSVEFFAGIAFGRGIRLTIPKGSDILKCGSLYGVERLPILDKMQVRRAELEKRLSIAAANEQHWATEKLVVQGMLGELKYWDMYCGASQ
jgi:hypothetical protein